MLRLVAHVLPWPRCPEHRREPQEPVPCPPLGPLHTFTWTHLEAGAPASRKRVHFRFPSGVSGTAGYKGVGTASLGHECPTVPQRKSAGHPPAHLLLQTDAKLLGGQRGPRRRHLGRRGRPALVQVPELLIIPEDTAETRLSPCWGQTPCERLQGPCPVLLGPGAIQPSHACV